MSADGKNSDRSGYVMWVVAGALRDCEDHVLMHRRPFEKHHGGLWEFPGGKVEHTEIPVNALIRELREELGIAVAAQHCIPAGFAESERDGSIQPIVILLYTVTAWKGIPRALEGGLADWFTADEIDSLKKPPLDVELARQLFGKA